MKFQAGLREVLDRASVEIVKRSDTATEIVVLPKRWIVERTIGRLNRCRRLAKDWECLNAAAHTHGRTYAALRNAVVSTTARAAATWPPYQSKGRDDRHGRVSQRCFAERRMPMATPTEQGSAVEAWQGGLALATRHQCETSQVRAEMPVDTGSQWREV